MLELTRKYQFHAARKLTSLPDNHPCSKIHDHQYLNDLEHLSNPTTEHLAIWIWNKLASHLKGLSEVTVSESNDSSCTYKGNE